MGKQFTVSKHLDAPGLPANAMYIVGSVVTLSDAVYADLPAYVISTLTDITDVDDPSSPDPSSGASGPSWLGPFTVTKDTPDDTPSGWVPTPGDTVLSFLLVTREAFDSGIYLYQPQDGSYVFVQTTNSTTGITSAASVTPGGTWPGWTSPDPVSPPQGGDVSAALPLVIGDNTEPTWTTFGSPATTGDADLYVLRMASPV